MDYLQPLRYHYKPKKGWVNDPNDPAVQRTKTGFRVEREGRDPVVYEGELRDLKILRDGYLAEIFVNGGEHIYTVLL